MIETHLSAAVTAIRKAGSLIMERERQGSYHVMAKDTNDYVTDTDKESERLIIDTLRSFFPTDSFFGEEEGAEKVSSSGRWVIDPIDGTVNFFRGIPNYTISIAWEKEPYQPLVGVIFNPRQNELYAAVKGKGATLNGEPIRVSSISDPKKAIVVTVPPHRRHEMSDAYFRKERAIFDSVCDLRSLGSCALELCYIAAGRMDCYYERALGYYDYAAGKVILEEAGGKLEVLEQVSDYQIDFIASNGLLHPWLRNVVGDES